MCNETPIFKCSFSIIDINSDTISSIGGFTISPPVTAASLIAAHPAQYWIEPDTNGEDTLCSAKLDTAPLTLSATNGVTGYTRNATLFGGHPTHRPGGKV